MKFCGFILANGKPCRNKAKFGNCYLHAGKSAHLKVKPIDISHDVSQLDSNINLSTGPYKAKHKPRPEPPLGNQNILDHPAHLLWIADATKRHTASNTEGLTFFQSMQNYHGMLALKRLVSAPDLPYGVKVVFAGGTCLALGHRVTERYSEDIDALLINGSDLAQSQRQEVLENVRDRILAAPGLTSTDSWLTDDFVKQQFQYPVTIEDESFGAEKLVTHVDIGFSDDFPAQDLTTVTAETFLSLRGDRHYASNFSDLQPFETLAARTNITLVEKMIALHQRAESGSKKALMRRARDVFDVAHLALHEPTLSFLQEPGSTAADIDKRLSKREEKLAARGIRRKRRLIKRPEGGFADSLVWQLGHPMNKALGNAYQSLGGRLIYDKSKKPPFSEVVQRVQAIRHLL